MVPDEGFASGRALPAAGALYSIVPHPRAPAANRGRPDTTRHELAVAKMRAVIRVMRGVRAGRSGKIGLAANSTALVLAWGQAISLPAPSVSGHIRASHSACADRARRIPRGTTVGIAIAASTASRPPLRAPAGVRRDAVPNVRLHLPRSKSGLGRLVLPRGRRDLIYGFQVLAALVALFVRSLRPLAYGLLAMVFISPVVGVHAYIVVSIATHPR